MSESAETQAYFLRNAARLYISVTSHPFFPRPKSWWRKLGLPHDSEGKLVRMIRPNALDRAYRQDYRLEIYQQEAKRKQTSEYIRSKSTPWYKYDPLPSQRHIRLLRIQPGLKGTPISGSFSVYSLDSHIDFLALSYTWGSAQERRQISCDGLPVEITQNLWEALQHLRHENDAPTFWIDALCINQGDEQERTSQVKLMGNIYRQASKVVVWIGDRTETSQEGLELIRRIRSLASSNSGSSLFMSDDPFTYHRTIPVWDDGPDLPGKSASDWKALEAVYWRPWWTRVWVIQEICLARKAVFLCGDTILDASDFFVAASFLHNQGVTSSAMIDLGSAMSISLWRDAYHNGQKLGLLNLLIATRSYHSSNKRDKVYALLGICADHDASAIAPNYSLSTAEVYTDLAIYFFTQGSFDILTAVCDPRWRSTPDLPSWVPDWAVPSRVRHFLTPGEEMNATASKNSQPDLHFSSDKSKLYVAGILFDTIKCVCQPFMFPILQAFRTPPFSFMGRNPNVNAHYMNYYVAFRLKQWERFARALKSYATREELSDVHLRTITADGYPTSAPRDLKSAYSAYGQTHLLRKLERGLEEENDEAALIFKNCMERACYGRTMFLTKKGYLGLGPLSTVKGDKVVILAGGRTPYVLRNKKNKDEFMLRGECYVHGIMRGEAWEDGVATEQFCIV